MIRPANPGLVRQPDFASKYRMQLPQLNNELFLTDGGIETTLLFHDGVDLPLFAAFHLLKDAVGRDLLHRYFATYAGLARSFSTGFVLESATWRASADWGRQLGYTAAELSRANEAAIELLVEIREQYETSSSPMVISGCIGPRGDGYDPGELMSVSEAQDYHSVQIETFARTSADIVTAMTLTNAPEAIGVADAAKDAGIPSVISFTVETDGTLPSGQRLRDAIEQVDAITDNGPAYYMINCAHPTHFRSVLDADLWTKRLRGVRANASACSHAELDESTDLDDGNPYELGQQYAELRRSFPWINVLGGCCGTDHRHIEQIYLACTKQTRLSTSGKGRFGAEYENVGT